MWVFFFFPLSSQKCFIEKYEKDNLALRFPPDGCSCTSISPACFIPGAAGRARTRCWQRLPFSQSHLRGNGGLFVGGAGAPLLGFKTPFCREADPGFLEGDLPGSHLEGGKGFPREPAFWEKETKIEPVKKMRTR